MWHTSFIMTMCFFPKPFTACCGFNDLPLFLTNWCCFFLIYRMSSWPCDKAWVSQDKSTGQCTQMSQCETLYSAIDWGGQIFFLWGGQNRGLRPFWWKLLKPRDLTLLHFRSKGREGGDRLERRGVLFWTQLANFLSNCDKVNELK